MATSTWPTKSLSIHSASLDRRGRLFLPNQALQSLTWLQSTSPVDALAVLDYPGHLIIKPLAPHRLQIEKAIEQAEQENDIDMLRVLCDAYRRLKIPADRRPTLGNTVVLHLGLVPGMTAHLYVHRVVDQLEVLTTEYRDNLLAGAKIEITEHDRRTG